MHHRDAISAIGLGVVIGYLDYILLPALVVMLIITFVSYRRYRRRTSAMHRNFEVS
jgi:uncharacterized membrane protein